jgi:hypothetical protein
MVEQEVVCEVQVSVLLHHPGPRSPIGYGSRSFEKKLQVVVCCG